MNLPSSPSLASKPKFGNSTEVGRPLQVLAMAAKILGFALLILAAGAALQSPMGFRLIAAGSIFVVLILLISNFPTVGLTVTFAFLVILGGVRRWLIPDFGWLGYDPLILIAPTLTILFFLSLAVSRRIPSNTKLARYIKFLLLIMAIQVLNPLQGGLLVGLGGILYYIAPLLWFYIGRRYGSSKLVLALFTVSVVIYTLTGIYGMKQVMLGISESEKAWVEASGYAALNISDNTIRVFSTFASTQEYAATLASAITICAAFLFHRKFQFLFPLAILVPALLYTGTRGPVVGALFSICIQWAFLGRNRTTWIPRLALAICLGVSGLIWSLQSINKDNLSTAQSEILAHQQAGLLNPTESTGLAHILTVFTGIFQGIQQPIGVGLGATTLAAGKLGNQQVVYSSEVDISNLFISLGVIGGVLYVVTIFQVFKYLLALWTQSRNITYLICIGLLTTNIGQWLNGGLYSLCFLNWFTIGMLDRLHAAHAESSTPEGAPSASASSSWKRGNSTRSLKRRSRNERVRGSHTSSSNNLCK